MATSIRDSRFSKHIILLSVGNCFVEVHRMHNMQHSGTPWIQSLLQCESDDTRTPKCAGSSDGKRLKEGQSTDLSITTGGNYMAMTARRNGDSHDFKEWEVHLTIPGKSCASQKDACSTDCTIVCTAVFVVHTRLHTGRAAYCNAQ